MAEGEAEAGKAAVRAMTQLDGLDGTHKTAMRRYRAGRAEDDRQGLGPTSRGSPEGRFLVGAGKALSRLIGELKERLAAVRAQVSSAAAALEHASGTASERKAHHRGGDRPWPLRLIIPLGIVAETLTAFVAMEVLVSTFELAMALAIMAALVGAGTACMIANRRLDRLPVPASARILEGTFVGVLTLLRFVSLDVQSSDPMAAVGGAALAALISAIALLAIEEAVVETDTWSVFVSRLRVRFRRWQWARAEASVARYQARLGAAGEKFRQHCLDFFLKAEGLPLDEAKRRAEALKTALFHAEASDT
jgi:hypothetical protein